MSAYIEYGKNETRRADRLGWKSYMSNVSIAGYCVSAYMLIFFCTVIYLYVLNKGAYPSHLSLVSNNLLSAISSSRSNITRYSRAT